MVGLGTELSGGENLAQRVLKLNDLNAEKITTQPNFVPNFSFEEVSEKMLIGWRWDKRNTDSTCTVDETQARSSKRSLKFTNNTPFGAHVYGTLWLAEPIQLQAGKPYTLSAYVKSDDPGIAWIGGGADWQFRLRIPPTQGKWQRISMTFIPSERDANFVLRIVTESPTKGFWVDNVKLEEGSETTFCQPYDERIVLEPTQLERDIEGDGEFTLTFDLFLPEPLPKALFRVQIGRTHILQRSLPFQRGARRVFVKGDAVSVDDSPKTVALHLFDGCKSIASAQVTVCFFSPQNASFRLNSLRQKLPTLESRLDSLRVKGVDIS